jgi:ubiquinone/menaquinone biosynthesis C-methylase UbiE
MSQQAIWEREYTNKNLVGGDKPALSFRVFCKWLRKERKKNELIANPGFAFQGVNVLDLGSGEGKNALYLAERGATVVGIEIAKNAITHAKEKAQEKSRELKVAGGSTEYIYGSIGKKFDLADGSVDLVLDVTSSNSLNQQQREIYLSESRRVLRKRGHMFVRALCKDSDQNAKQLIIDHPGPEPDTYILPEIGITERVFTEKDIKELYSTHFDIIKLEKEFHYTKIGDRSYKRAFWVMYLIKKGLA